MTPASQESRLRDLATGHSLIDQDLFRKPYDVAAAGGMIVVTDSLLNVVYVFDVPRKKIFAIGWRKEGKLIKPLGVAMDKAQNIYVVDSGRGAVIKYDRLGLYLSTIGVRSDFSRISDVAVTESGDTIYILDRGGVGSASHRIIVFDASGTKTNVIGQRGHKPGEFNHPTQLAVGLDGHLIVLDSGNFRVQIFDSQGRFLKEWGRPGKKIGNLARPRGIAIDSENRIYVTDSAYQNVQIFNYNGELLISIGRGGGENLPGNYILPAGVATDETGRFYVVDQIRKKIEVFRMLSPSERQKLQ